MLVGHASLSWLMIGLALVLLILTLGLLRIVTQAQQQLRQQIWQQQVPYQDSLQRDMPLPPASPERVWRQPDTWNGRTMHGTQLESEE